MRYFNTVKVDETVWKNIREFTKHKAGEKDLFDLIGTDTVNEYLKTQMEGLTAKTFRTYNASFTL